MRAYRCACDLVDLGGGKIGEIRGGGCNNEPPTHQFFEVTCTRWGQRRSTALGDADLLLHYIECQTLFTPRVTLNVVLVHTASTSKFRLDMTERGSRGKTPILK